MLASGRPVVVFGDTESSRAILEDLPGVYSFDASSSDADIERLLANVADYDPEAGWPARYAWLRDKTWPSIFSSIFGRYL